MYRKVILIYVCVCVCVYVYKHQAPQVVLVVKNPPVNAEDIRDEGSIPGSGSFPGGEHGNSIYILFQILFHIGSDKILNTVACAIQNLVVYYCIYSSMYLLIPSSQFIPSPC